MRMGAAFPHPLPVRTHVVRKLIMRAPRHERARGVGAIVPADARLRVCCGMVRARIIMLNYTLYSPVHARMHKRCLMQHTYIYTYIQERGVEQTHIHIYTGMRAHRRRLRRSVTIMHTHTPRHNEKSSSSPGGNVSSERTKKVFRNWKVTQAVQVRVYACKHSCVYVCASREVRAAV